MRSNAWIPLLLPFSLAGSLTAAPIIDRVLAVVSGNIITLSDVNAAIGLGLVNTAGATDPVQSALEQLIDRTLMLAEVDRYAPPEPSPAALTARIGLLRSRLGSEAELEKALAATGLTEQNLEAIARQDMKLDAYLNQRFASMTEASDDEVLRYYREHQNEFIRDGAPQPLIEVEAEVRRRLDAARRAQLVDEWTRQLRQRADVLIVPK